MVSKTDIEVIKFYKENKNQQQKKKKKRKIIITKKINAKNKTSKNN